MDKISHLNKLEKSLEDYRLMKGAPAGDPEEVVKRRILLMSVLLEDLVEYEIAKASQEQDELLRKECMRQIGICECGIEVVVEYEDMDCPICGKKLRKFRIMTLNELLEYDKDRSNKVLKNVQQENKQ